MSCFLELKQRLWDDCHFGLNDEINEFSGDLDEYGMLKISSIKHRPTEELYEIVDFAVGQKQEIDKEYIENHNKKVANTVRKNELERKLDKIDFGTLSLNQLEDIMKIIEK